MNKYEFTEELIVFIEISNTYWLIISHLTLDALLPLDALLLALSITC